jgi:uncharacterized protein
VDQVRDPAGRLADVAPFVWALEALGMGIAAIVVAAIASPALDDLDGFPGWVGDALLATVIAGTVLGVLLVPILRHRRWRWELSDDELRLRRGVWTEVRTVVPTARIQHVDIKRGVLARMADVAAVTVHTAAGETSIPVLTESDAVALRDRIAALVRTADEG